MSKLFKIGYWQNTFWTASLQFHPPAGGLALTYDKIPGYAKPLHSIFCYSLEFLFFNIFLIPLSGTHVFSLIVETA